MTENEIAEMVVDTTYQIHVKLGPGLFESVYRIILAHELRKRGLKVKEEEHVPVVWDGIVFENGFRVDILVDDKVIVELKSTEKTLPVHKMQVKTYLKVADKQLGLLVNFGEDRIKYGISRIVNNLPD